jgi:Ca2+-binding RTX toxin-like protein
MTFNPFQRPSAAGGLGPAAGSPGPDLWIGTDRADFYNGAAGNDILDGGKGNDRLFGGAGEDYLDGGKGLGRDFLSGGDGVDTLFGGAGDDNLIVSVGADLIDGGDGVDTLNAKKLDFGVVGNARASGAGWPSIPAHSLTLGNGDVQTIVGVENFIGSNFDDTFYAVGAAVRLVGGKGDDWLESGAGTDTLIGGQGHDVLQGENGDDVLDGGTGNDVLIGGLGNDTMVGGRGNDQLNVTGAYDEAYGGDGNDTIVISEGGKYQIISGGAGRDTFQFGISAGVMQDFTPGQDHIDLQAILAHRDVTYDMLEALMTQSGADAVLTLNIPEVGLGGWTYVFKRVDVEALSESDFII